MTKETIAIIPARGGSKGIPRKNVRIMAGVPLIAHVIRAAINSSVFDRVFVSTEDEEIAEISGRFGASVLRRPKSLSGDSVTLDPVISHAVKTLEARGITASAVGVLQPTSPTVKARTITAAYYKFISEKADSLISATDATHLYWRKKGGTYVPLFPERLNRQYLPVMLKETGAFTFSRRRVITDKGRFGRKISFYVLPENETADIDTPMNWWVAEKILTRKKIAFRVDGYDKIGLGHVYRALTLAQRMMDHEVVFLMDSRFQLGIALVRQYNFPVVEFRDSPFEKLDCIKPEIVINDVLDTTADYMLALKKTGVFTVNFEDLGAGSRHADLLINALYGRKSRDTGRVLSGPDYECLRDEFYSVEPRPLSGKVKTVLVTFGGTDENNLTIKSLKALEVIKGLRIFVILGLGHPDAELVRRFVKKSRNKCRLMTNVRCMSRYMRQADIAVTSCGRTVFEMASVGVPCVAMAQNRREMTHTFASPDNGVLNLGLGKSVTQARLRLVIKKLISDSRLRGKMRKRMAGRDIKTGTTRVINAIFGRFYGGRREF